MIRLSKEIRADGGRRGGKEGRPKDEGR